jgi:Endonuclease IV (EC 3.1.21.-)
MVKIFLGPAGIPHASSKRNTLEGVKVVKDLGLNAMEVEFVQGVKMSEEMAEKVGKLASELGVRLSVHAPYAINLCSEDEAKIEASKKRLLETAIRAEKMGADAIAIHAAFYGRRGPEECYELVKEGLKEVVELSESQGLYNVKFGVETMAKDTAFGTIDEVISISKDVRRVIPYIDWAHTFARQGGQINYDEIINRLIDELGLEHINSHFESLVHRNGKYVDEHLPIDNETPPFRPLAEAILKNERLKSITLICESPELERDALKMRKVLEELGYEFS